VESSQDAHVVGCERDGFAGRRCAQEVAVARVGGHRHVRHLGLWLSRNVSDSSSRCRTATSTPGGASSGALIPCWAKEALGAPVQGMSSGSVATY
jgi:hypothetical protein